MAADSDVPLTLTITEPEDEAYGDTSTVTVRAPSSFTVVSCTPEPPAWECAHDSETGRVTFSRTVLGALGDNTLQFTVHTSPVNGTYAFTVTQADGAEEPMRVTSKPAVTVTGGQRPPADDDGGSTGGSTTDGSTGDTTDDGDATGGTTGSGDGDAAGDGSTDTSSGSTDGSDSSSTARDGDSSGSDSTAPHRTQGRSAGTTLEVTPREQPDDPTLDAPAVADEPAVAPPPGGSGATGDRDEPAAAVAASGPTGGSPTGAEGPPWQQVLGAALLVAGGAVVAVRRWGVVGRLRGAGVVARLRGWDPLARIRRWRGS